MCPLVAGLKTVYLCVCLCSSLYQYYLFDLLEDPYETTNLYYSEDDDIETIKDTLYGNNSCHFLSTTMPGLNN
jgi:hypothetical protein